LCIYLTNISAGCRLTKEQPTVIWSFEDEDDDRDYLQHTLFLKHVSIYQIEATLTLTWGWIDRKQPIKGTPEDLLKSRLVSPLKDQFTFRTCYVYKVIRNRAVYWRNITDIGYKKLLFDRHYIVGRENVVTWSGSRQLQWSHFKFNS